MLKHNIAVTWLDVGILVKLFLLILPGYEPFECDWMTVKGDNLLVGSTSPTNYELKVVEFRSDLNTYVTSYANWTEYEEKIQHIVHHYYNSKYL